MLYGSAPKGAVVAATTVMTSLAGTFVGLRLFARLAVTKNAGWDDGFIFGAFLFSIATTVTMIAQTQTGLGKHEWEIGPHDVMLNLRAFWAMIIVYNISLTCTKISILIQYLRIFPQKPMRIATWSVMGVVIVYALWRFFSAVFTCVPVNAFWDHSIEDKKCQDRTALSLASTSLNMSTDIAIAILPLPYLSKLQLPPRQKYALMAVFSLAGLVVIISILRLPSLYALSTSKDISYENPMACIWSTIEVNIGIICSCLPTLRCLFPHIFENLTGGGSGRYNLSGGSQSQTSSRKLPCDKKSARYAHMGATSSGGSGSFGGKFSTNIVSTPLPAQQFRKHQRWGSAGSFGRLTPGGGKGRNGALLSTVDEIELGSRNSWSVVEHGHFGAGDDAGKKIYVQTEIEQVESVKSEVDSPVASARDMTRQEGEMV